jgi:glutathione peroxidase
MILIAGTIHAAEAGKGVHDFSAKTIEGKDQALADYKGKALLIVNTASRCGFTPQYKSLQALYDQYQSKGLEILAFPANDFMSQEPGTDTEIKKFCTLKYNVSFPLFSKIHVKGGDMHPLYRYLTEGSEFRGPISWNFNKFLVAPDGRVVARFDSTVDPLSTELVKKVTEVLPKS